MKLPNGITGFTAENQLPMVNRKEFNRICCELIRRNGGKIIEFQEAHYPTSFYSVHVECFYQQFYILLNKHYPYLAFAAAVEFAKITFIDEPVLSEQFPSFYHVLTRTELYTPFKLKAGEHDLNSAEMREIAYWQPETIGQVIFNDWD